MSAPNTPETRGRIHLILLILLAAAFAGVLLWMLNLRLSGGDTYPPYSSFRADPLGTRALHKALDKLDGVSTTRHIRNIQFLKTTDQTSILFLGLHPRELRFRVEGNERKIIERWLDQGCRIIIALSAPPEDYADRKEKCRKQNPSKKNTPKAENEIPEHEDVFGLEAKREPEKHTKLPQIAQGTFANLPLPVWHGTHVLHIPTGSDWSVLATANDQPTIALLQRGKGSLVVTTDSYPFSNEAQTRDRHTPFLLALLGDHTRVVFDESHLGVLNEPGLMNLVRQYHLHGIVAGGLLLFVILLWQGSGSLIPVDPNRDLGSDSRGVVGGRDSSDGLVALLETGLNPQQLLDECVARHLTAHPARRTPEETIASARDIAKHTRTGQLASDYNLIARLLSKQHSPNPNQPPHHGNN
jgi:hypothetical protein